MARFVILRRLAIAVALIACISGCNRGDRTSSTAPGMATADGSTITDEPIVELHPTKPLEALPPLRVSNEDWPWWRGPARNGVSTSGSPPTQWQEGQNILWKVPLAGRGNSSPIVVQDRIYLSTSTDSPRQEQLVVAFDVNSGQQLWTSTVHTGGFTETMHPKGTYADATLACDGERLFAVFLNKASIVVTALTLDGDILWQTGAGPFRTHSYGFGASPVVFESLVIVAVDDPTNASISALRRDTGEVFWRIRRPSGESYATPVVADVADRWQLLINGKNIVSSYDPSSGELLWSHPSAALVSCNTMVFGDSLVFASGGMPDKETTCFRAGVDDTDERLVWRNTHSSSTCYVPSLLLYDRRLFNLNDEGVLTCFNQDDGRELLKKRFNGTFTATPVVSDGKLIIVNEEGVAWVIEAAPPFKIVSENRLESGVFATPAICRDRIYLRSANHLYCIGSDD